MSRRMGLTLLGVALSCFVAFSATAHAFGKTTGTPKRSTLVLTASPLVAFAPSRIILTGRIEGGADDDEQLYCPAIEWDWGDGTTSENSADCTPFQAGKTSIQRMFIKEHIYRSAGEFRVKLTLKRRDKALTSASTLLELRSGMGDDR